MEYIKELVAAQLDYCMNWTNPDAPGACNKYFTCIYNGDNGHGNSSSTTCPPPGLNYYSNPSFHLYYTLVNETGFFAEIESSFGIVKDWVQFGKRDDPLTWTVENNFQCPPEDKISYGYPIPAASYTVDNPKNIFTNASLRFANLQATMFSAQADMVA